MLRRMIYTMCMQKPPNNYSEQLYNRYKDTFTVYIYATVGGHGHEPSVERCHCPARRAVTKPLLPSLALRTLHCASLHSGSMLRQLNAL